MANAEMLNIKIRRCKKEDIGFVYELMRYYLADFFNNYTNEGWSRQLFKEKFDNNRVAIIEHEDMPIGFVDYEIINNEIYIHNCNISHDYQGLGIGSYIVKTIEDMALSKGIKTLRSKIFIKNKKSLAFALKNGFVISDKSIEEESYIVKKTLNI